MDIPPQKKERERRIYPHPVQKHSWFEIFRHDLKKVGLCQGLLWAREAPSDTHWSLDDVDHPEGDDLRRSRASFIETGCPPPLPI